LFQLRQQTIVKYEIVIHINSTCTTALLS